MRQRRNYHESDGTQPVEELAIREEIHFSRQDLAVAAFSQTQIIPRFRWECSHLGILFVE
jgi:hypothetical protein